MRGRKATLTAELVERFAQEVEHVSIVSAARIIGYSASKAHEWLKLGRDSAERVESGQATLEDLTDEERLCIELVAKTDEAVAKSERGLVCDVRQAQDWKAQAWLLERRHVDRWGRRRLEITGADGGPLTLAQIDAQMQSDDEHARSVEEADGGGSLDG